MNMPKIKMPKEAAKEEWKKYNELLKKRKDKYLSDMKKAMYHLKEGKELIDQSGLKVHSAITLQEAANLVEKLV